MKARRYKTACIICDKETRNTGKTFERPIDVCWVCHKNSKKKRTLTRMKNILEVQKSSISGTKGVQR